MYLKQKPQPSEEDWGIDLSSINKGGDVSSLFI